MNYKLTTAEHLEQMNDTNRPTEVLEGFKDLSKHYRFMSQSRALETKAQAKPAEKINPAVMKHLTAKSR